MRPATLAQAVERVMSGEAHDAALAEYLDTFYLARSPEQRFATLAEAPALTGDERLDALVGAMADYLARQYRLPHVPDWTFASERFLERPWHMSPFESDGMREFLTFSSPAEFSARNIFTEERPLRRARAGLATVPKLAAQPSQA
jgi:hypothetical protein